MKLLCSKITLILTNRQHSEPIRSMVQYYNSMLYTSQTKIRISSKTPIIPKITILPNPCVLVAQLPHNDQPQKPKDHEDLQ